MIIEDLRVSPDSGYMSPRLGLKQKYCDKLNRMNPRQIFRYLDRINEICKSQNTTRSVSLFIQYSPDPFAQNLLLVRWNRSVITLGAMQCGIAQDYMNRGFPLFTGHIDDHRRKAILVDFYPKN